MKPADRLRRLVRATREKSDAVFISSHENVQYFSGFTGTAGAILGSMGRFHFFTDGRYLTQSREEVKGYRIHIITQEHPLSAICKLAIKWKVEHLGVEETSLSWGESEQIRRYAPKLRLTPIQSHIRKLRVQKDRDEIAYLRKACGISDRALATILHMLRPGVRESEIASELEYQMRQFGASQTAFETIVASGPRSALPHGIASNRRIKRGDLVVIDFGADYGGYKADITRTFVIGPPNAKQLRIWKAVFEAQKRGIHAVRPGIHANRIDKHCRGFLARKGLGKWFVHGTGHGVGLDIHEAPTVSSKNREVLLTGMVITVEPGVYLPGWGGVRIEDTLLVTKNGVESLTQSPKVISI